jgi:hypothetical protein
MRCRAVSEAATRPLPKYREGRAAWRFDIHLLLEAVREGVDFDVSV